MRDRRAVRVGGAEPVAAVAARQPLRRTVAAAAVRIAGDRDRATAPRCSRSRAAIRSPASSGTFTWGDGGSDSPWLPGAPIAVGTGEQLTVTIGDGVGVATWSARRVPAGTTDGSGAVGLGTDGPPIAFGAPETGSWSVQVTVDFDGGLGSASYYWLVTVR